MKLACCAIVAALSLAACNPHPNGSAAKPPLQGSSIGGPFALIDGSGRPVSDRSFAGKYRIMYFGYTYCPDVCPTDVQAIGAAMRKLEASDSAIAAKVVPIFVTVDPARDTPAVVRQFTQAFYPRMAALTGSPQAIAKVAKEYAVYYSRGPAQPGGGYLVNHSRQTYLMDPDNKPLALLPSDQGGDAVAAEIKRWVT